MAAQAFGDLRKQIGGWVATALATTLGFQLIRILLPGLVGYLRDSQGVDALQLAPIAVVIFGLSFLAGGLWRVAGPRLAIWITAGGLAIARLLEQISTSPSLDLAFSAIGVALFLLFIPAGLASARARGTEGTTRFGLAFLLGVSLDTAIHVGGRTLDLSWQPGPLSIVITALLAAGLFIALWACRPEARPQVPAEPLTQRDTRWRRSLALVALGLWQLLQLQVFQNVARVSALTGWETPAAGAWVVLGNALGLAGAAWVLRSRLAGLPLAATSGLLLSVSLIYAEPTGILGALLLLAGQILGFILMALLFRSLGQDITLQGLARTTVANGIGQILFVILTFIYYVTYDMVLGFRAPALLPASALLVTIVAIVATSGRSEPQKPAIASYRPAIVALVLLVVPLGLALAWNRPQAIEPDPANTHVRVIDYNVHNGFNTAGRLDMEALATIIEESGADVVGLQEISRGWLIWGRLDMLTWLSQRLDMPYVSGPTADAQWGNAVLSRYPIVNAETFRLPPDTVDILRGYIVAEIDIGARNLQLIDTHFSHHSKDDPIRVMQASALANAWDGAPATVIVGDMNAVPDSEAMQILSRAGLVNVAAEIGTPPIRTSPSNDLRHQIDYIWASPDLHYSDLEIIQSTASDHLPVIATITLP